MNFHLELFDTRYMSAAAATGLSTLLAIVYFAYIIEAARMSVKPMNPWSRRLRLHPLLIPMGITAMFLLAQALCLMAMNRGELRGEAALAAWVFGGVETLSLTLNLVLAYVARNLGEPGQD